MPETHMIAKVVRAVLMIENAVPLLDKLAEDFAAAEKYLDEATAQVPPCTEAENRIKQIQLPIMRSKLMLAGIVERLADAQEAFKTFELANSPVRPDTPQASAPVDPFWGLPARIKLACGEFAGALQKEPTANA